MFVSTVRVSKKKRGFSTSIVSNQWLNCYDLAFCGFSYRLQHEFCWAYKNKSDLYRGFKSEILTKKHNFFFFIRFCPLLSIAALGQSYTCSTLVIPLFHLSSNFFSFKSPLLIPHQSILTTPADGLFYRRTSKRLQYRFFFGMH